MILWTILIFLTVLSVLVVAHEFGHYYAAKKMGVRVDEFAIGFPPRLFSFKDKDGMVWAFNAIPLGGYVKIHGETGENKDDKDSFAGKSIWARLLILAAGVMMNLVLASVLFAIGFTIGLPVGTEGDIDPALNVTNEHISVVETVEGTPAGENLQMGDTIVAVDGQNFESAEALRAYLEGAADGGEAAFTVLRNDSELTIKLNSTYIEQIDAIGFGAAFTEVGTGRYPWYLIPWKAIETTFNYTVFIAVAFAQLIGDLVTGAGVDDAVAGPVGIAVVTGEVASLGFNYLLQFAAILSINLAILNILPLPALDGGRMLFVAIEAVRGKPNSQKIEAMVHNAGFMFLLVLVVIVTFRDIANLL